MSALAVDAKQIRLEELLDAVEQGTAGLPRSSVTSTGPRPM